MDVWRPNRATGTGGPPYFWFAEAAAPAAGSWHATLTLDNAVAECTTITREIAVSAHKPPGPHAAEGSIWQVRNTWNRTTENLYSSWTAKPFDAPLGAEASWKAWHELLRDRSRNFLFNYLGLGEDNVAITLRPDYADFVYFLRAYFGIQDGSAVRVLELLARQRRGAAEVLRVVRHSTP